MSIILPSISVSSVTVSLLDGMLLSICESFSVDMALPNEDRDETEPCFPQLFPLVLGVITSFRGILEEGECLPGLEEMDNS